MRKEFIQLVSSAMSANDRHALFLGDIGAFGFRKVLGSYPERAFNLGILEQTMVGVAAGMALRGFVPTIHTIAPFLVERAFEQIKVDFGYQKLAGNFVSVGASFDYSKLGATHHCPADVGLWLQIPQAKIFFPGHAKEFAEQFDKHAHGGSLNYFRLSERANTIPISVEFGKVKKLKEGSSGVVVAAGNTLSEVLAAVEGLDVEVHYMNSIDMSSTLELEANLASRRVILVEPYYSGPMMHALHPQLTQNGCRIYQVGVPRKFIHSYGTYDELLAECHLDSESLRTTILDVIEN